MVAEDDQVSEYVPHANVDPLRLEPLPVPPPTRTASSSLLEWIRGPSDIGDSLDAEAVLGPCTARWQAKWDYFQSTFPEGSKLSMGGMTRTELLDHVRWLDADLNRVWTRLSEVVIKDRESEIYAGSMFIGNLVDEVRPLITSVFEGNPAEHIAQAQRIEIVYQFALQSLSYVLNQQQENALGAGKQKSARSHTDKDNINFREITRSRSAPSLDGISLNSFPTHPRQSTTPTINPTQPQPQPQPHPSFPIPTVFPPHAQQMQPSYPHQYNAAGIHEAQTHALSSATSHKTNLGALLGISFFGASISWSTVFSGTRGDLVIISWAASVFIVGAVSAASGSALVETDDNIMVRFMRVRWVVRVLTILSMLHAFAGMMLVSVAILLLDPDAEQPEPAGAGAGATGTLPFRRGGTKSAGVFAVCVSSIVVLWTIAVRRRYSTRTWFV